jgi:hypothetical protein
VYVRSCKAKNASAAPCALLAPLAEARLVMSRCLSSLRSLKLGLVMSRCLPRSQRLASVQVTPSVLLSRLALHPLFSLAG